MAVITVADYKLLVTDYSTALDQIEGVSVNYYNAAYKVLLLNVFDPEIDLLVPFHNAYLVADVSFAAQPQSVVNAIQSLQQHILAKGTDKDGAPTVPSAAIIKFNSVDEYYLDNAPAFDLYFTAAFAALSQQAGFTIGTDYIIP